MIITALDIDLGIDQNVDIGVASISITLAGIPTQAPLTAPSTSAPSKIPTKAPSMAPTEAPSKAPSSTPPKAPGIQCSGYTGGKKGTYKTADGCKWHKGDKVCKIDSANVPEGCNSYTDEGSHACRAVIGCAWFANQCI